MFLLGKELVPCNLPPFVLNGRIVQIRSSLVVLNSQKITVINSKQMDVMLWTQYIVKSPSNYVFFVFHIMVMDICYNAFFLESMSSLDVFFLTKKYT